MKIYLDDIRTPVEGNFVTVRNFDEIVNLVNKVGLSQIELISLDHDLGDSAMQEYYNNVSKNFKLDYDNILEKTGYDVAKFLVEKFYNENPDRLEMNYSDKRKTEIKFPEVVVHSANPIGSANIMGYINNFLMNEGKAQTCIRKHFKHVI